MSASDMLALLISIGEGDKAAGSLPVRAGQGPLIHMDRAQVACQVVFPLVVLVAQLTTEGTLGKVSMKVETYHIFVHIKYMTLQFTLLTEGLSALSTLEHFPLFTLFL